MRVRSSMVTPGRSRARYRAERVSFADAQTKRPSLNLTITSKRSVGCAAAVDANSSAQITTSRHLADATRLAGLAESGRTEIARNARELTRSPGPGRGRGPPVGAFQRCITPEQTAALPAAKHQRGCDNSTSSRGRSVTSRRRRAPAVVHVRIAVDAFRVAWPGDAEGGCDADRPIVAGDAHPRARGLRDRQRNPPFGEHERIRALESHVPRYGTDRPGARRCQSVRAGRRGQR